MWKYVVAAFDQGILQKVRQSESLFFSGDPVVNMYLVVEGSVALLRQTSKGTTTILHQAQECRVLAEASAYSKTYHCDAVAKVDSVVRAVPVAVLRRRLLQDSQLSEAWASHLAFEVQSARMLSEIRTLRTVGERLDVWLKEGRAEPEKGRWQELAAQLGVTREALYRELAKRRKMSGTKGTIWR